MQGSLVLLSADMNSLRLYRGKTVRRVYIILPEIEVSALLLRFFGRQQCKLLASICVGSQNVDEGDILCVETARGHKRIYRTLQGLQEGFDVTDDKEGSADLLPTLPQTKSIASKRCWHCFLHFSMPQILTLADRHDQLMLTNVQL